MTESPTTGSNSLDLAFLALADPTRRAIIDRLVQHPASVSALAEPLGLSLPAIGHHLQALQRGGLIHSTKAGRVRTVSINAKAVANVERWIASRRRQLERRADRLQTFLATRREREGHR